jgi:decaprenylphospho-beta-D-erythro-pentofuranosid-2-ulose 2-reductase
MYPRLGEWQALRAEIDPAGRWRSDLGIRVGLVDPPAARPASRLRTAVWNPGAGATGPRRVLLMGGSSEIGLAILRRLAADGPVQPYLLGRDHDRLLRAQAELERAGCDRGGGVAVLDAHAAPTHEQAIADAFERAGGFDVVVLAIGVLGAQAGLDADPAVAAEVLEVNFIGCGQLLLAALRRLRAQGGGSLIVLSSVAVERPRAGNAVYGAAKAGFDALAQGLADSLAGTDVHVLVVRPGFVYTKMTAGLEPAPFATTPEAVAEAAVRGLRRRAGTVWVPAVLRPVFSVLRHLPRPVYRSLPL